MRFALEVVRAVRKKWPKGKPLFYRTSSIDGIEGGWTIEDTVALAKEVKAAGVDVIDCSAGGFSGSRLDLGPATWCRSPRACARKRASRRSRSDSSWTPEQAEAILERGDADLVALGRQALLDPHWAGRAAVELEGDAGWSLWPAQYGWWLERRAALMRKFNDAKRA